MLLPFGLESHDYKLENMSIADMSTVAEADLIIYVGGESDSDWIEKLKSNVKSNAEWMALTDTVDPLSASLVEPLNHEALEHKHEHEIDEHVWTSPKRAIEIVESITERLCTLDEANSKTYRDNLKNYKKQLNELDNELTETVKNAKQNTLVFSDRFPFRYLCHDYKIEYAAAFTGCSALSEPTIAQINQISEAAVSSGTKYIFYMEKSNTVFAEKIASTIGIKTAMLHSCHNITREQFEEKATYYSLMKNNLKLISEALI